MINLFKITKTDQLFPEPIMNDFCSHDAEVSCFECIGLLNDAIFT